MIKTFKQDQVELLWDQNPIDLLATIVILCFSFIQFQLYYQKDLSKIQ